MLDYLISDQTKKNIKTSFILKVMNFLFLRNFVKFYKFFDFFEFISIKNILKFGFLVSRV